MRHGRSSRSSPARAGSRKKRPKRIRAGSESLTGFDPANLEGTSAYERNFEAPPGRFQSHCAGSGRRGASARLLWQDFFRLRIKREAGAPAMAGLRTAIFMPQIGATSVL